MYDLAESTERTVNGNYPVVRTAYSYDDAGRVATITHGKETFIPFPPQVTPTPLATFVYGYDSGGRLATESNAEGLATLNAIRV